MTTKIIFAYATYTLMMMVYSLINVPYASLLGVMSANPQVRTEFSSYRMTFAFGGSILVLFLIEPLVDISVSYTHLYTVAIVTYLIFSVDKSFIILC